MFLIKYLFSFKKKKKNRHFLIDSRSACTDDTVMTCDDEVNIDFNVNENPIENNFIDI